MSTPERPTSLKRTPKPAKDERIGPVAPSPKIPAEKTDPAATSAPAAPRRREATIPLGTRVAPDVMELLDLVVAEQNVTQRAAIEMAIRSYWGDK